MNYCPHCGKRLPKEEVEVGTIRWGNNSNSDPSGMSSQPGSHTPGEQQDEYFGRNR